MLSVAAAAVVGVTLVAVTAVQLVRPSRAAAAAVLLLAALWLLVNRPVEGPTLWVVSHDHGLTVADLLSFLALGAVAATWPSWRSRPPAQESADASTVQ